MVVCPDKYHLLVSWNNSSKIAKGNKTISGSKCEKLLGIKIDNNLNFKKKHIESLCTKESQKISVLGRLTNGFWIGGTYNECSPNLSLSVLFTKTILCN